MNDFFFVRQMVDALQQRITQNAPSIFIFHYLFSENILNDDYQSIKYSFEKERNYFENSHFEKKK